MEKMIDKFAEWYFAELPETEEPKGLAEEEEAYRAFVETLSDEQKPLFSALMESVGSRQADEETQSFQKGFRAGVRTVVEALKDE